MVLLYKNNIQYKSNRLIVNKKYKSVHLRGNLWQIEELQKQKKQLLKLF
jgi:hypothetical protein